MHFHDKEQTSIEIPLNKGISAEVCLFYWLLFEKYFRVSSRICLDKTRSSSSFNHASVLLRKKSRIFSSAESITILIVQEEGAEQQFSLYK
jgi:hypothetical protein